MSDEPRASRVAAYKVLGPLTAAAVPVVAYFWFLATYGYNTIVVDQWADIDLLRKLSSGHAGIGAFWAAHNENRMLFPNLIVLALAHLDHLDTVTECYLSAVLLLGALAMVVAAQHLREPGLSLWSYVPPTALLFTLSQYTNTLLGFQIAWYLALACLAAALLALDRPATGLAWLVLAFATAVVASYSTIEGLLVWPAGLALLLARRRPLRLVAAWLAAGAVVSALYAYNLHIPGNRSGTTAVHHPLLVAQFFFVALGDVFGFPISNLAPDHASEIVLGLCGALILAISIASLVHGYRRSDREGGAAIGCALIVTGLCFGVMIAVGRAYFGVWEASASRFVTFDVLPLLGSYLVLVSRSRLAARERPHGGLPAVALAGLCLVTAVLGAVNGIPGGRSTLTYDRAASDVIVNIHKASNGLVAVDVYPLANPLMVRNLAAFARNRRLSLFDTPQIAYYTSRGLDVGPSYPLFAPKQ